MLLCGSEIYGDYNLKEEGHHSGEKEFERDHVKAEVAGRSRMPSFVDQIAGVEFSFEDDRIAKMLDASQSGKSSPLPHPIEFTAKTTGEVLFTLSSEEDILKEILMILSTCHECVLHRNKQTRLTSYQVRR